MTAKANRTDRAGSIGGPGDRRVEKVVTTTAVAPTDIGAAAALGSTGKQAFAVVLKDVLTTVSESARQGFVHTVIGATDDDLDPALWGRAPSAAERKEAALGNLRRQYESRREVVEASLTRAEAAELLGVSEQAVLDRLDAGDLIGLKKGREWRLPTWQFNADAERGFVPGLARLREVFPGGSVSMTQWVTSPHVELAGATPADVLAGGHVDVVVHAASTGTAAAW